MNKSCIARLPENERDAEIYCSIQNLTALTEIQNGGVPKSARFDSITLNSGSTSFVALDNSSSLGVNPLKSVFLVIQAYDPSLTKVTMDFKVKRSVSSDFIVMPSGTFLVLDAIANANEISIAPVTAPASNLTINYELRNY